VADSISSSSVAAPWWVPLTEIATHILGGAILFIVLAVPAVGLDLLLHWLPQLGVSTFILTGLVAVKFGIFGVDLVLFSIYMLNTSWHFVYHMKWRA
jgi:hypothetical protein